MPNAQTYLFPTSAELERIDRDLLPVYLDDDPINKLFPEVLKDASNVIWEQEDNFLGRTQFRGYEAEFPSVPNVGFHRFTITPGVYGEFAPIGEFEMTERRGYGTFGVPVEISDLVRGRQDMLMTRHFNRRSSIMWTLLATGEYKVQHSNGTLGKWDSYQPQYYFAPVPWATLGTAGPLADFRAVQLLHRGHSVMFNSGATGFMNLTTWNNFISNTNAGDLGDRRQTGFQQVPMGSEEAINNILTRDNLPNINVFDGGYLSDGTDGNTAGTFVQYIPDATVVVVGKRTNGAAIGEFQLTRNASNANMSSAPLVRVIDTGADDRLPPPRLIKVYRGFNGGPAIKYASAVVIMKV